MMLGGEAAAASAPTTTTATAASEAAPTGAAAADPLLHNSTPRAFLRARRRVRQRVDAGEPRNSYSSIPGYSFRRGGETGGQTASRAI